MPAIPIVTAAAGVYSAVDGADKARKAAHAAQDQANAAAAGTGGGAVDIAALDKQARDIAQRNAADSAALEAKYNPGASQLRSGSLQSLLDALNGGTPGSAALDARIAAQAGNPLSRIAAPGAEQYDSALTRQAIEAASRDLALGGELPQDVRNLVARNAFARSGSVTGNLGLGRDITARDLGLTSLDLYNRRLQNAATIGAQEAALGQGNAALRQASNALGVTVGGMNLQGEQYGRQNLFDSASFLQNIQNGDFARALAAAQLGQNIAAPTAGLDPGAITNLAVGNSNNAATAAQNAAAVQAQAGNQKSALGGQLIGTGLGFIQDYLNKPKPVTPTYTAPKPSEIPYYGFGQPGYN